jgi:hypothetical protein
MEGFAVTIQDRVIKTTNDEKHCLRVDVTKRCRKYDKMGEKNWKPISWVVITIWIRIPRVRQPTGGNNSPTDCHNLQATWYKYSALL